MNGERRWWRNVPTLVAVLGLLVALSFNTVGVWMQVAQSEREREATDISLLTQLTAVARAAEARLPEIKHDVCDVDIPTESGEASLRQVAHEYDFLAWLFNQRHIRVATAREFWTPSMLQTWELAATISVSDAQRSYPNLTAFRTATPERLWPPKLDC